ncbi:hypothetical protein DPMN_085508 [Dreissena polymorpha]|uniref:NACHT domain-containing protein n=1 Tax=Dreissena polymorpha TaxID=45954 RepID=A0A9D3YGA8_DREPO|nr:hypothetical protein DPMN_085508 [Dreissena polymorpha]
MFLSSCVIFPDLLRRLEDHYRDTVIFVPLSTLDLSRDKHVQDIYASPKIHRMKIENDGRRTKQEQIFTYTDFFYKDNQLSRRTYLQGEPGSGKTTFVVKLVNDWCNVHLPSMGSTKEQTALVDVGILQKFKFLFFISLRDSRNQTYVTQMIKTQLIDKIYADGELEDAYKLVLQIMKTSTCLVIQDGLDEWPGEDALPSMAGILQDHCIILTTSRPWKLADERIRNSQIDILLDLEGISDPKAFNEKVLRCLLDESTDLKEIVKQFEDFFRNRNLQSIPVSPMLNTLIICTWVEGIADRLSGSSLCELYTTLLESLCKKANPCISHFNESEPLPVNCFSRSKYIKPNIQDINVISKAAFSLLFSNEREMSIVFNEIKLSEYLSDNTQKFALKSGLLSIRKPTSRIDNTCSFAHKSVQEFLAAFHISGNVDVIKCVISEYFKRHGNTFLDISQVFVFLCGLNITAANKLSKLMNLQAIAQGYGSFYFGEQDFLCFTSSFQRCVFSGYKEAAANKNTPVQLHLSHLNFDSFDNCNMEDFYHIWAMNVSRARSLSVNQFRSNQFRSRKHITIRSQDASSARPGSGSVFIPARDYPVFSARETQEEVNSSASFMDITLTSCHRLEQLNLEDNVTVQPNSLVGLNNLKHLRLMNVKCEGLDLSRCHKVEHLDIQSNVTLKPNALVGLNNLKFLQLSDVKCERLDLSSCKNLERLILFDVTYKSTSLLGLKNLKYIYLWYYKREALDINLSSCVSLKKLELRGDGVSVRPLYDLKKLKHLRLDCTCKRLDLSYFEYMEVIDIGSKVILLPLSTQNYKNLKQIEIMCTYKDLDLSLLENVESIQISEKVKVLPKRLLLRNKQNPSQIGLYDFDFNSSDKIANNTWCLLNSADPAQCADSTPILASIKNIRLTRVKCSTTWLRNLFSTLLTLDHKVCCQLDDCQITSSVEGAVSRSLMRVYAAIHTDLNNTVKITNNGYDLPDLWESVYGLRIKSFSLGNRYGRMKINHGTSFSQSLRSLKLLETLKIYFATYIDLQLPQSLKHVALFYDKLFSSQLRDLVNKLSALPGPLECRTEFGWSNKTVNEGDPHKYLNNQFPAEEYFLIKQELEALENVKVKRFRIYDRSVEIDDGTTSAWSLRRGVVNDGDHSDDMADDEYYETFVSRISYKDDVFSRISMRLQIFCV